LIVEEKEYWFIILISDVSSNLNKSGWVDQTDGRVEEEAVPYNVNN